MMETDNLPLILMYHSITKTQSDVPPNREEGAELYDVSVENFRQQLKWLKDAGYTSTLNPHKPNPADKEVVFTFDDGELNNLTQAMPLLKEFGFSGYFFIIGKRVGKSGYLNWPQIKELHKEGMAIGSHGLSHEILTNLLPTQAQEELRGSKVYLERNLNVAVDSLSIPRGFCNNKIIKMAYQLGYQNVFISDKPRKLTESCFSRIAVKGSWDMKRFIMACQGKTPYAEGISNKIRDFVKTVLGEEGYNQLRKLLVNAP